MPFSDPYHAVHDRAGFIERQDLGRLRLTGKDRRSYLHGILTNDIEGLAAAGGRLFLGLRGPVLRGWAVVLEVALAEDPDRRSTLRLQAIGPHGRPYRKHFLHLGGLGIRDLCAQGTDLLILAGPTMDLDGPVTVFRWPGGTAPGGEAVGNAMARRLTWGLTLAVATAALGAAMTSTTAAADSAVTTSTSTIATAAGPRPLHIVRIVPGRGVRLQAVWLGGGPGRAGTVGAYIRANAARGAVAGLNGDFFLLARNLPSGNLLIHKGRSFLGGTNRGAAAFGADGSVDIVPGHVKDTDLMQDGVREAISGKPVYVHDGRIGDLTTLEPYQRDHAYHRTAVGRLRNGQTALVVIGGAGTTAPQFAQALIRLGFVEALGMDIDSSANINWRGASLNRPDYQRLIPTGIIAFRRVG